MIVAWIFNFPSSTIYLKKRKRKKKGHSGESLYTLLQAKSEEKVKEKKLTKQM